MSSNFAPETKFVGLDKIEFVLEDMFTLSKFVVEERVCLHKTSREPETLDRAGRLRSCCTLPHLALWSDFYRGGYINMYTYVLAIL